MSEEFSTPPGAYIRHVMATWMARRGWLLLIPALALLVAGMYDLRWIVAALMWVLIIMPGVLAFVYIVYGISQDALRETTPHTVEFIDDTLVIQPSSITLTTKDIDAAEIGDTHITIRLKGSLCNVVIIPRDCLTPDEDHAITGWLTPWTSASE